MNVMVHKIWGVNSSKLIFFLNEFACMKALNVNNKRQAIMVFREMSSADFCTKGICKNRVQN